LNALGAPLAGRGRHVRAFPGRSTDPSIVRNESAVQQPGLDWSSCGDGVVYIPSTGNGRTQPYAKAVLCTQCTSRPDVPELTDRDIQHVTGPAGFRNRVHKFDSCRGHDRKPDRADRANRRV
jgi:hypothetical protein